MHPHTNLSPFGETTRPTQPLHATEICSMAPRTDNVTESPEQIIVAEPPEQIYVAEPPDQIIVA